MKVRIPAIVGEDGRVSAIFLKNSDGKIVHDISIMYDDFAEDEKTRLIHIEAEIDVDALFASANVSGRVV